MVREIKRILVCAYKNNTDRRAAKPDFFIEMTLSEEFAVQSGPVRALARCVGREMWPDHIVEAYFDDEITLGEN